MVILSRSDLGSVDVILLKVIMLAQVHSIMG